jgi:hypothetical protein
MAAVCGFCLSLLAFGPSEEIAASPESWSLEPGCMEHSQDLRTRIRASRC